MQLTDTQHRILVALCRPARSGTGFAPPATNQEIADEVFLSVDAVKAHLRTLYRKFGIEELPHNQKRARLVELVLEGGYLEEAEEGGGTAFPAPAAVTRRAAPAQTQGRRRPIAIGLAVVALAVVAVSVLALAGAFSSGGGGETTSPAAYRKAVGGYCRLGLESAPPPRGGVRERARSYLAVIETVRGRVESLPPPAGSDRALERFRAGLTAAANFTGEVAERPPPAGSREQANVVAELTLAAGQVQAGALGYQLGGECLAVGDLITRSARNAAHVR
jgi:hypothetical protein